MHCSWCFGLTLFRSISICCWIFQDKVIWCAYGSYANLIEIITRFRKQLFINMSTLFIYSQLFLAINQGWRKYFPLRILYNQNSVYEPKPSCIFEPDRKLRTIFIFVTWSTCHRRILLSFTRSNSLPVRGCDFLVAAFWCCFSASLLISELQSWVLNGIFIACQS